MDKIKDFFEYCFFEFFLVLFPAFILKIFLVPCRCEKLIRGKLSLKAKILNHLKFVKI